MTYSFTLPSGHVVTIDEEDRSILDGRRWYALPRKHTVYVFGQTPAKKNSYLHRLLLNPARHEIVDHINGDGLDNRRVNLRTCTQSQNMMNTPGKPLAKSGYRGVVFHPHKSGGGSYTIRLKVGGRLIEEGGFSDAVQAALYRDQLARQHHGDFAVLNFPDREAA